MANFVCVLKSGGDYGPDHLIRFWKNLKEYVDLEEHTLVCLTDFPTYCPEWKYELVSLHLLNNWPGWWSKLEAFRLVGPIIYMDIDTVIQGSLDPLIRVAESKGHHFGMIRDLAHPERWASGVMLWSGDMTALYQDAYSQTMTRPNGKLRWDQKFIEGWALKNMDGIVDIGALVRVRSWKRNPDERDDATLLCFHGLPRIQHISDYWARIEDRCDS